MKVQAFPKNGNLAHTARSFMQPEQLEYYTDIPCEGNIVVTKAYINHGTVKEHNRPYLVLDGVVTSIEGEFPNQVSEVYFNDVHRQVAVSYQYQFTNEELADMCQKGLFDNGFSVPEIFTKNNGFSLPMICDCVSVKGTEVPILLVDVQSRFNLEIDSENCGYTLGDYFEKASVKKNEFIEEDEFEQLSMSEEESLFEEPQTEEEKIIPPELPPELTDEEKALNQAFTNIEGRVERKVLQAKDDSKKAESKSEDSELFISGAPRAGMSYSEMTEGLEPESFVAADAKSGPEIDELANTQSPSFDAFEDEDFVPEDEVVGILSEEEPDKESESDVESELDENSSETKTEPEQKSVSETEEQSEKEKKKSSTMQTAAGDIKEAVVRETSREVPEHLSEIAKSKDSQSEDESEFI